MVNKQTFKQSFSLCLLCFMIMFEFEFPNSQLYFATKIKMVSGNCKQYSIRLCMLHMTQQNIKMLFSYKKYYITEKDIYKENSGNLIINFI